MGTIASIARTNLPQESDPIPIVNHALSVAPTGASRANVDAITKQTRVIDLPHQIMQQTSLNPFDRTVLQDVVFHVRAHLCRDQRCIRAVKAAKTTMPKIVRMIAAGMTAIADLTIRETSEANGI
jgi:hypothetical protein